METQPRLNVPAAEFQRNIGRYQHRSLPPVAGDRDGLGQSEVLVAADVPLELGGGDFEAGLGFHELHKLHEMG